MHLISAEKLKKATSKYPDVVIAIKAFYKTIEQAQWQSLVNYSRFTEMQKQWETSPFLISKVINIG
jgi:mRNA-degrading endonuclease HigB of HigAB toxin-antitoxin module